MAKFIKFPSGPFTVRNDIKKKNKDGTLAKESNGNPVIAISKGSSIDLPGEDTVDGQMLRYLQGKYGDQPTDQYDVMLELNDHQKDDSVLTDPAQRIRPLSQVFAFKVADWYARGFVDRATAKELTVKEPGKMAKLEARVAYLEKVLADAGIQYDKAA